MMTSMGKTLRSRKRKEREWGIRGKVKRELSNDNKSSRSWLMHAWWSFFRLLRIILSSPTHYPLYPLRMLILTLKKQEMKREKWWWWWWSRWLLLRREERKDRRRDRMKKGEERMRRGQVINTFKKSEMMRLRYETPREILEKLSFFFIWLVMIWPVFFSFFLWIRVHLISCPENNPCTIPPQIVMMSLSPLLLAPPRNRWWRGN